MSVSSKVKEFLKMNLKFEKIGKKNIQKKQIEKNILKSAGNKQERHF